MIRHWTQVLGIFMHILFESLLVSGVNIFDRIWLEIDSSANVCPITLGRLSTTWRVGTKSWRKIAPRLLRKFTELGQGVGHGLDQNPIAAPLPALRKRPKVEDRSMYQNMFRRFFAQFRPQATIPLSFP